MITKNYITHLQQYKDAPIKKYASYMYSYLRDFFPKNKKGKILDIGCGNGNMMLALKELGYGNITGFDIDASNVEFCKKKKLSVMRKDILKKVEKKFANSFDFVYSFDVIEHIPKESMYTFISRCLSCVKPGGVVVIKTVNLQNPLNIYARYMDITHTFGFTKDMYEQLMGEMGLHNYQVLFTDAYPLRDKDIFSSIVKFICKLLLRIGDLFLQLYMFVFIGGRWINVKREIILVIKK